MRRWFFALEISHIGYHNNRVRLDKEHLSDLKIYLTPHANMLNEIVVYAHNPRLIVEEAIRKIPVNYSNKNNMLTGFYRETVQKGRRYINISEAIIDVYKTSYEDMTTTRDRVQVLKGRRLLSQKVSDTLGGETGWWSHFIYLCGHCEKSGCVVGYGNIELL